MEITRISYLKKKIHFCLTHKNNKLISLIQSIISHFLEHIDLYGKKGFKIFGIWSGAGAVFSRGRSRIRIHITAVESITDELTE